MKFYSTAGKAPGVSFEEAVLNGLAPDGGLYLPEHIGTLPPSIFDAAPSMSMKDLAFEMAVALLGDSIDRNHLEQIVAGTLSFDAPLVEVVPGRFSLELFHGPTLAFKDFGARFLSRVLGHYAAKRGKTVSILVATSGDTGSAVAHGFLGTPGIRVVILYPSGKVSDLQEKQFTTLGGNITALEVDGVFDDCQRLVKQAFSDTELRDHLYLASANSINIARLIPQSFYYGYAWSRLAGGNPVFSVPSGNFGNLTAGLLAKRMGFPIGKFIASTNVNDVVPEYLKTGHYIPRPSKATISNAMDVGNPSNFDRIRELYGGDANLIRKDIVGYTFSDSQTADAMREVLTSTGYRLDPHGAVGWLGLDRFVAETEHRGAGVFLETAHPAKFLDVVEAATGRPVPLPSALEELKARKKLSVQMGKDYEGFREWIVRNLI